LSEGTTEPVRIEAEVKAKQPIKKGEDIMVARRYLVILVALSLLVLLMPACGDDDDDDKTTLVTSQATTTMSAQPPSAQPTNTTTSDEPVKIGVLTAWTGPAAMAGTYFTDTTIKTVEKQVEEMGGILGGRPVEFVRYDTAGQVAGAIAGARRAVLDGISVLTVGGATPAEFAAMIDVAEEEKVFYVSVNATPANAHIEDLKYTVEANMSYQTIVDDAVDFVLEVAAPRPDTVGIMTFNDPDSHDLVDNWKKGFEPAGIEVVYEQYINRDVLDLSPYLTKLKHADPDYSIASLDTSQFMAIAKQIEELGGWGDMQMIAFGTASAAVGMPGAEGWILIVPWHPSMGDPASTKFKEDFEAVNGRLPTDMHVYFYNSLWTAIHAIELAGTDDPMEIARAARSGNLEFDTPMGRAHFDTAGHSGLRNMYVQVRDGEVVPFSQ